MLEKQFPRIRVTNDSTQNTFRSMHYQLCLQGSYPAADVAKTTLEGYLNGLWEICEEASTAADPELVRHLRVTARRSSVALSIFSPLLSKKLVASFKQSLHELRRTAGATRDYDVLCERLQLHLPPESSSSGTQRSSIEQLLQLVAIKQIANRQSISAIRSQLMLWEWHSRVDDLTSSAQRNKKTTMIL